ncbi:MAG: hypothetical protein Kow0020_02360 [Wenzhouxiangellaceae bacterium]
MLRRFAAIGLSLYCAAAAAELPGRPEIIPFDVALEVYPTNFSVAQGPEGLLYVANAEGLLVFDGERWQLVTDADHNMFRTLVHDGADRLYAGGYDRFGYFTTPVSGYGDFVDLTPETSGTGIRFGDIWQIEITAQGVFFLALRDLYRFDPESRSLDHWHHDGGFGALAEWNGQVYVQYRGEGLRVLTDGRFEPVPSSATLTDQLFELLPLEPDGRMLATSRDGRWWLIDDRGGTAWQPPAGFPDSSIVFAATVLSSGWIAFGTINGWVYVLAPDLGRFEAFRATRDWISDLVESPEGGLVALTDHQVLFLRWPAQLSGWDQGDGLGGSVNEVLEWQQGWLVISDSGVFASDAPTMGGFHRLPWTDFEAFDFEPLADGTGLLADSYALLHVDREGVRQRLDELQYPRRIVPSRYDAGLYFIGTEEGVATVRRDGDRFMIAGALHEIGLPVFSLVETGPGVLLLGTQGQGVVEVHVDADGTVRERRPAGQGIDPDEADYVDVLEIDGRVYALTYSAVWRREEDGFVRTDLQGVDSIRKPDRYLEVRTAPDGSLWAYDYQRVYRHVGADQWEPVDTGRLIRPPITSLDFDSRGRALIGGSATVAIVDREPSAVPRPAYRVLLRDVRLRGRDSTVHLPRQPGHRFPSGDFEIRFEYALPGLVNREAIRYRARLAGLESAFGPWEQTSRYTYSLLDPGQYRFEVQAMDPWGRISELEPFEFGIAPAWYESAWFRNARWAALTLLLSMLVWLLMRARMWRVERERRRLASEVQRQTQALVEANRRLREMAEVDGLTGIANRRRFDTYLNHCVVQARESHRPLAVMLVDLDGFKPYNDRCGHLAGDEALKRIARRLTDVIGNHDRLVARFGGDEFAAVIPDVDERQARQLGETACRACLEDSSGVSLSVGIAWLPPGVRADARTLTNLADRELYRAKKSGKNRVSLNVVTERAQDD